MCSNLKCWKILSTTIRYKYSYSLYVSAVKRYGDVAEGA
jgi:hypothetical protein